MDISVKDIHVGAALAKIAEQWLRDEETHHQLKLANGYVLCRRPKLEGFYYRRRPSWKDKPERLWLGDTGADLHFS